MASWMDKLVGRSPIRPMQEHMTAAVECARVIVPLMKAMAAADDEAGELSLGLVVAGLQVGALGAEKIEVGAVEFAVADDEAVPVAGGGEVLDLNKLGGAGLWVIHDFADGDLLGVGERR